MRLIETVFRYRSDLRLMTATNGEHGLDLATRYLPDAIMLDIHLPGMDGYAVLAALQQNPATRHIPVIAVSADAMPIDVERGLKAGFSYYVVKPVIIAELMAALDRLLPKR
jgi:CheY-like chemotaxis protein